MARVTAPIVANQDAGSGLGHLFVGHSRRHFEGQSVSGRWNATPPSRANGFYRTVRFPSSGQRLMNWDTGRTALKLILLLRPAAGRGVCDGARTHRRRLVDAARRSGTGVALARYQERNVTSRLAAYCGTSVVGGVEWTGSMFATARGKSIRRGALSKAMRDICTRLKVERATPHDLRRTHGSTITALGFGRDAMNRVQNHKEGGIGSVYDRHGMLTKISGSWKPWPARSWRWWRATKSTATLSVWPGKLFKTNC